MTFRVLATARSFCNTPGPHLDLLRQNDCDLDLRPPQHPMKADALGDLIAGYDGVVLGLDECDASVIERADRLKVISRYGSGTDKVDIDAATQRGIAVTNTPGVNRIAVTELTMGLMLSLIRSIPQVVHNVRQGVWERARGTELYGKTLGIIGFGAIGREVAARAQAFGMRVIAYDPFVKPGATGPVEMVDLPTLLHESHIITLHAAHSTDTLNLINAERIAQMRDGAYLINTARGELINEADLYDALKSGKLAGAAVDVFHSEPPEGNPLLTLDNFIATLHMAGTSQESVERMALQASQNLLDVLRGEPCEYILNPAALDVRKQRGE